MEDIDDRQLHRQILPAEGPSTTSDSEQSSQFLRHPKRRAPITNVACDGCRKRKTKCNGARPACGNCLKRGVQICSYDVGGPQSSKIANLKATNAELQTELRNYRDAFDELHRLREEVAHLRHFKEEVLQCRGDSLPPHLTSSQSSLPLDTYPLAGSFPRLPPIAMPSRPMPGDFRSRRDDMFSGKAMHSHPTFGRAETSGGEKVSYGLAEENRLLNNENEKLKELMVVLTYLDDSALAETLASRIQQHGVTDGLLSQVNNLFAAGRTRPSRSQVPSPPPRTRTLPALSSLDLPALSAPQTPELDANRPPAHHFPPPFITSPRDGIGPAGSSWR
ncbi:hypothetical protein AAFC00_007280 [Neodothiora populina]